MTVSLTPVLRAVVFDMDGLLVDTEPLWRRAELDVLRRLGVPLTEAMCFETTGLRVDEVVRYWHARYPWSSAPPADIEQQIVARVVHLLPGCTAQAGMSEALGAAASKGLRLALASSSSRDLIDIVLDRFGLSDTFDVVHSAEAEPFGKPHPGVYLTTAAMLGVSPEECIAVEDSLVGVIAAKAARMTCFAVPGPLGLDNPRFAIADLVVSDLHAVAIALEREPR